MDEQLSTILVFVQDGENKLVLNEVSHCAGRNSGLEEGWVVEQDVDVAQLKVTFVRIRVKQPLYF
jgi:hypothetical protein